uniref:Cytochrome P450 n=1 Tax=Gorilla gorilla gorilla TaxID=9595 RepID=G3S819_GORGO
MLASGLLLVALLASLTVMVLMSVWQQRKSRGKLPLGPTPLPFIGNYLQLNTEQICDSIMKISERYGPVFTIHLGPRRVVVLCGHDAIKEALVDQAEEFSGRGEQATFKWVFKRCGEGRTKPLRRFSIATLRDFGVGKRGIKEVSGRKRASSSSSSIDPTFFLSCTTSNVISSIFTATSTGQLYEMFSSVMKHLPGPQQQAFKELQGLEDFIAKKVEHNQCTLDPNSPWDFIDSFLICMQGEEKNPNTEFYLKNLVMTTLNLFYAGTETVSTTLHYGFLLLMKHPEVEAKVHEEIDRVIGKNQQPKFEDRAKTLYTEAVIHEIQRFGDLLPMGVARRVKKDTKFRDFFLSKGIEVFPMLGSVLRDLRFFSNPRDFNPQHFNPQHFLGEKGQFKKRDAFVPFSIRRRNCFREGLARMELFLYLTTIMQNFRFKSRQSPKDIVVSPKHVGFVTVPRNYTKSYLPC